MTETGKTEVLFVCLGNICRSPTAHGVFNTLVEGAGLSDAIRVDSCGTGDWHVGSAPDARATQEAAMRGYDLTTLRARQITLQDFEQYDYILAMDKENLRHLKKLCPGNYNGQLQLFLSYANDCLEGEVPDPYYGGEQGFSHVLDLVEAASEGLLKELLEERKASAAIPS